MSAHFQYGYDASGPAFQHAIRGLGAPWANKDDCLLVMMHPRVQLSRLLWQAKASSRTGSGDEMIISAGNFLVQALKPAARRMAWERGTLCLVAFAALGEPANSSRCLMCMLAVLISAHSAKTGSHADADIWS